MNLYRAFYKGKSKDIEAQTQYGAYQLALIAFEVPVSQRSKLSVMLVSIKGEQHTHSTSSI